MLKLKEEQLGKFSTMMQASFAERMRPLVRRHFPEQTAAMSEAEVGGAIDAGIAGASSYGIGRERDVERYIYLMFTLGFDFDRSVPWAGEILGRSDWSAPARMDVLCAAYEDRLVEGPDDSPFFP